MNILIDQTQSTESCECLFILEGVEVPPDFIKENFVNHSCDGNAWFIGDDKLVACRKIKKGEEIAYVMTICKSKIFICCSNSQHVCCSYE
jgi:hypothetical protein